MNIPVFKPYLSELETSAAVEALQLGWLGPGSYVKEFEQMISDVLALKNKHVVAVNTGTSAVHLALKISGVSYGDEVITPSFNNIADFQAIKMLGADPVFCDILKDTLVIDPNTIEPLISAKTKAIICLDYGAALCDYDLVKSIADKYSIPVVHDAAHAFGSALNNNKVGSYSDICAFSFDPVKNITCIDGGAVIVGSIDLAKKLQSMRLLGQQQNVDILYENQRSWTYDVDDCGYRYHLANLHAAIGVQQIKKIEHIAAKRRSIFNCYINNLSDIDGLILPKMTSNQVIPFIFVVRILNEKRDDFRQFLLQNGVDTGIHWQPGHKFSFFNNCKKSDLKITDQISTEIVTLPMFPDLSESNLNKIIEVIKKYFRS